MHLLKKANLKNKKVLLRGDFDVPITSGKIEDDFRLTALLPTIEYLLGQNCQIVLAGHLGRPEGKNYESRSKNHELSLSPIAEWFLKKFKILNSKFEFKLKIENLKSTKLDDFDAWQISENFYLLENLRFYTGEEANDLEFAKKLTGLADVFVNDAFAMCHRKHASIVGVASFLPHYAGLHLEKEIETLTKVIVDPQRPLAVIIGGAKLETKLPLVEKMHRIADYVLIGGKLADETRTLFKIQHEKALGKRSALLVADLDSTGYDITQNSVENFLQIIKLTKTVIWNGPLGKISPNKKVLARSEEGSKRLAEGLVRSNSYLIVGGGDTVGFLEKACLLDKFACMPKSRCFLSTGGGAMLSFLSGEKLPGIEVLLR